MRIDPFYRFQLEKFTGVTKKSMACDMINGLSFFQDLSYFVSILNGILLPKLFWPTVRKNCSIDREKKLKFEAEGQEFS